MVTAKTDAAGDRGLLPEVLAFTSSLEADRHLLREDLVGSLAHLTMLSRQKIVAVGDAAQIKAGLIRLWNAAAAGTWRPEGEEDVHMAVEAELTRELGPLAGRLHSARSRNDQVALDLHLHVRAQVGLAAKRLGALLDQLATLADAERETVIPSYTHRQRAQPVSLGYVLCSYGAAFARDVSALRFVLEGADVSPLGVGAIAGTSLPIKRETVQQLLGFRALSMNGMDTVGDRDFALDFAYAAARCLLHASRLSTDFVDFASGEFKFLLLDGQLACGSSMMPQKKNPDVFELIRGKSGPALGNLTSLLVTVKGLPGGYNRDLQEDRGPLLSTGPLLTSVLEMLVLALPRVGFDRERCKAAVAGDYTQATDLAEALVLRGMPFRTAYQLVGSLVRSCQAQGLPLAGATLQMAQAIDPSFDAALLAVLDPTHSHTRRESPGGTGPNAVAQQVAQLRAAAAEARALAETIPSLESLFTRLTESSLEA